MDGMYDFTLGFDLVKQPKILLASMFWSFLAWLCVWLQIWVILHVFGIGGSLVVPLFVAGVTAFGAALPSSPGALGVYELSMVAGLLVFGHPQEIAVGVAILTHALQLGITGLIGAVALAREGETLIGLAGHAQSLLRSGGKRVAT